MLIQLAADSAAAGGGGVAQGLVMGRRIRPPVNGRAEIRMMSFGIEDVD